MGGAPGGLHVEGARVGVLLRGLYQEGSAPVQADERYFLIRVASCAITTAHHTALEQKVMTQHRWFTLDELGNWSEALFPENLAQIVRDTIT